MDFEVENIKGDVIPKYLELTMGVINVCEMTGVKLLSFDVEVEPPGSDRDRFGQHERQILSFTVEFETLEGGESES